VTVENDGTNNSHAGGVVGYNGGGTLTACYATGNVIGTGTGTDPIYVGGVTGSNNLGTLTACYHAAETVSGPTGTTGGVAGRNFKGSMSGGGIITACYWGGGTGGTTQVTDGLWQNALAHMNAALSGKGWQYELKDGNSLPTLKKEQ
ncbi:GLUG motif-containing protein, partial [uncultured Alistipes sp.]|uniref:GLUG motif-containing protein n=1 Tax=uncultured Alistipes sp. TaxID=538949 RepID=UPI002629ED8C